MESLEETGVVLLPVGADPGAASAKVTTPAASREKEISTHTAGRVVLDFQATEVFMVLTSEQSPGSRCV